MDSPVIFNSMKTKHLNFIILLLVATTIVGCASKQKKDDPLVSAQTAYESKDYDKAAAELMPLAKNGDAKAQYTLGYMYYYGQGVKRDRTQGYFWMQQSAKQGNKEALQALELLNKDSRTGHSN